MGLEGEFAQGIWAPNALRWKREGEDYSGDAKRHWALTRRRTEPAPRAEIQVAIADPRLLELLMAS